jgi:hypothetical protein
MPHSTEPPDAIQRIDADDPQPQRTPGMPSDVRDEIERTEAALRPAVTPQTPIADVDEDFGRAGTYTTEYPTGVRRPHAAEPAGAPQVTRDPSMSRAVDAAAAGLDPRALGFDDSDGEIGHPGPLAPDVRDESPLSEDEPAGKYGSSG